MRLNKYIAFCGAASRRKADELVLQGRVRINGILVKEVGVQIEPGIDTVEIDGKTITPEDEKVYIMLNKPTGYVSTAKDQFGRKTVLDLVDTDKRVYPVGRLDYDTSGLIILTNDGDFSYAMTHPKHEIKKVYIAKIKGKPSISQIALFERGLRIEGYTTAPSRLELLKYDAASDSSVVRITIHEGKNRQVRKMCDAIGHPVMSLSRVQIGHLNLGDLEKGKSRPLKAEEVKRLLKAVTI
ncbi:pseudouridine synthase [Peptoclostridium acidaminophilum]